MGIVCKAAIRVAWDADEGLPAGSSWRIYADGETIVPVDAGPIRAWPDRAGKRGFGTGRFGRGRFGRGAGGLGFGSGRFGRGRFGVGSELASAVTRPLADGLHTIAVAACDPAGNESDHSAPAEVLVQGTPRPPRQLAATAYAGETLTLSFRTSADDEG